MSKKDFDNLSANPSQRETPLIKREQNLPFHYTVLFMKLSWKKDLDRTHQSQLIPKRVALWVQ